MAIYEKTDNLPPWRWTFQQYTSPAGRKAIDDWRKALAAGPFRADMDTFFQMLGKITNWPPWAISALNGANNKGLTEIRWASGNVQHRVFGYVAKEETVGKRQYVMLVGCTHKQKVYSPADAMQTARDRKRKIETGEATTSEYPLVTNR